MQLKYCVSFMKSRKLSRSPARRPRSRSMALGGLDTLTKSMASPPTVDRALRIARRDREALRRLLHLLHDEGAVHAHALRIHVDVAAGILQDLQRLLVEEEDADLLQDAHRAVVDALDPFLVERLDRPVAVLRDRPGHLVDGGGAGALTIAGAPAGAAPAPLLWLRQQLARSLTRVPCTPAHVERGASLTARRSTCSEPRARDTKSEFAARKRSDRDIG